MKVKVQENIKVAPKVLIIPMLQDDEIDKNLASVSQKTGIPISLIKEDFKAKLKETQTFYFQEEGESKRIILLGLGEKKTFADVLTAFRSLVFKRKNDFPENVGVDLLHFEGDEKMQEWIEAAINGIMLGRYDIGLYKTAEKEHKPFLNGKTNLDFFVPKSEKAPSKNAVEKGIAAAETQLQIYDLVNAPSNKKTPQTLAEWAINSGEKYGYKVEVFEKEKIKKLGLDALLAVNRGSENPPTFIVMEYKPKGVKNAKKVGLVGKGVTFDTGGLSIKPSTNMHYMKSDMGGAAAVMGAMELTAKLELPVHLIGIVPATDNSVDAMSVKPGDVINSYSGKTIEIIDTDAEGRLILADGLAYMIKHYQPEILLDLATLTGSVIRSLGTLAGGLFSKNTDLSNQILAAGERTGERLWQFPMWDEYNNYMKSDVADIKNFSGKPVAGAITAAKFLELFTEEHPIWAHLDIAGVAVHDSEYSSQKSATAFGVRLLIDFLENLK